MDFRSLLCLAQKNCKTEEKEVKYFKASLDPVKKESKETRKVSEDNVKKFLAKKKEKEGQIQLEKDKGKEELTSSTSRDKTSSKRVRSMLKRTESANKSVIEDAKVDVNSTSVTLAVCSQPDEDDYGYVSKVAAAVYDNIMEKYASTPADTRNTKDVNTKTTKTIRHNDLSVKRNRVKFALLKEAEKNEKKLLRPKRKRNPVVIENGEDRHCNVEPPKKKPKTDLGADKHKKRRILPPPISYQELLKIAEKIQHEPVITEKKKESSLRLMTKKEKQLYLEEQKMKARRNAQRREVLQTI